MKKLTSIVAAALCAAFFSFALPGCGEFMQNPLTATAPVNESVVVNAEKTLKTSKDTFDFFLHLEKDNEALIKQKLPQIHTFAEYLRKNAPGWLIAANTLKNDYKHGNGNLQALLDALNVLNTNTVTANQYVTQINNP
jgi:hypothetical protein